VELCSSLEYFLQKLGLLAGQKLSTSWRDSIEKDKRDGKQLNGASEKAMHPVFSAPGIFINENSNKNIFY